MVLENNQAPDTAKIHEELVVRVKYSESQGDIKTSAIAEIAANTTERIKISREIALTSPSL